LATEASRVFTDLAFSQLQLPELFADVEAGNDASERILQKLGFVYFAREELPARVLRIYRLRKDDWAVAQRRLGV
jgi:RimJ/RimL family protein N-acetyltransferase